ncbi:CHAP domain-containing protein [Candidatus Saccharibacteria bacterium]|nr:CHAP domain-containing protein [Candidatus Saccharibacteria bacterium]
MRFRHHITKTKTSHRAKTRLSILFIAAVFAVVGIAQAFNSPTVQADKYDEKIKALQAQIDGYNSRAKELAEQADTLNNKIAELQNEQAQLQAEINLNNTKRDDLTQQIADNEAKLQVQSSALSKTLADIYYSQQTSTLDIILNSNSVSDYVDKAARQNSMKDQISSSVNDIKNIKAQLEQQKAEVEQILRDQEARSNQLAASQSTQQSLLNETQGQEASYQNMIKANTQEIEKQRAAQRAANASYGLVAGNARCGGGYPYCDRPFPNSIPDPWGMYMRQCVSYTAFKVASTYGKMPYWGGRGNANQWVNNARNAGIPTGSTPKVGSVGATSAGPYGHVVWVEQVSDDGKKVYISQYNAGMDGNYSEQWISASAFTYIYFGDR